MKVLPERFDVIIIGAGPAGTCAAIRLLAMGYLVGLVEETPFPRNQIGESLSPGIQNIFSYLDAGYLLEDKNYLYNIPARVIWQERKAAYIRPEHSGNGVVVNRSLLDQQLLTLATDRGLHVFQPAKLDSCVHDTRNWRLNIKINSSLKSVYSAVV